MTTTQASIKAGDEADPVPDGMCACCWENDEETPALAGGLCAECIEECQ